MGAVVNDVPVARQSRDTAFDAMSSKLADNDGRVSQF